jgi:hypothetical protein
MILRTAYQSGLYHFMKMENQTNDLKSFRELMAKNFTLYSLDAMTDFIKKWPRIAQKTISIGVNDFEKIKTRILSTEENIALLATEDQVAYWNKMEFPHNFYHTLPQKLTTVNLCLYLPKTSPLIEEINKNIFNMYDNGFLDVFKRQAIDMSFLRAKKLRKEPKNLNFNQLKGAWYIFVISLGFSVIVFIFELIIGRLRKKN